MKRLPLKGLVMACLAAIALSGCAHVPGGIAPSNVPIGNRKYKVLGRAVATDSVVRLLGIIPLTGSNSMATCLNDCIRSRQGDAMVNITSEGYGQFWILFTRHTIKVEGDVIKFEE